MKSFTKTLAKAMAVACAVVMLVPANVQAATDSGEKKDISAAKITIANQTYTGKTQTAKVTVKLDGVTLKSGKANDYTVAGNKNKNAGSYKVTVTGVNNYTGTASKSYKINKAAQAITYKTPAVKASAVKSKAKTYKLNVKGVKEKGKVTYASNSKKITVNKSGVVTVKKGTKKGTSAKITITVAATKNYKKTTKTLSIKVK